MIHEEYDAVYNYFSDIDVVNIEISQMYNHGFSVELGFGIILDFDENYLPVNLEILSASKVINVDKKMLCNPNGDVKIYVGEDIISVEIVFKFENNDETLKFKSLNDLSVPVSQTNFSLV